MDARSALLAWYEPRRRAYPWRTARPDPYRVLVSEVMLQQTQAARVADSYRRFLRRFSSVRSLARASRGEVMRAWSGLGYNRRAVALSEAARTIVRDHGARVPGDPERLRSLPGVGGYTAAAVASIAFGHPVAAVDANVERVVARALLGMEPHEAARRTIAEAAEGWLDRSDPGIWNQAVMDLGRRICRPVPRCGECPLSVDCASRRRGAPARRSGRRQPRFEGSDRQVRGAVIRALAEGEGRATLGALAVATGWPLRRVARVLGTLAAEGLVVAGPAALQGRPRGRVALPR